MTQSYTVSAEKKLTSSAEAQERRTKLIQECIVLQAVVEAQVARRAEALARGAWRVVVK